MQLPVSPPLLGIRREELALIPLYGYNPSASLNLVSIIIAGPLINDLKATNSGIEGFLFLIIGDKDGFLFFTPSDLVQLFVAIIRQYECFPPQLEPPPNVTKNGNRCLYCRVESRQFILPYILQRSPNAQPSDSLFV